MFRCLIVFCCLGVAAWAEQILCIGIAGGSCSGKTTLANRLHRDLPESVVISQDFFYKDISHLPLDVREQTNFDHPDSLDIALLRKQLIDLKNGIPIDRPTYNYQFHGYEKSMERIEPARVIIVEGILVLAIPEIRELFDIKIFVEAPDDIRLLRRIEVYGQKFGHTFDFVKEQYFNTVKPMHKFFIEPSRQYADLIFPGMGNNQVAIDIILSKLKKGL